MKLTRKFALALALSLPVVVFAQTSTPRIDQRDANQEARIQQGANSGSLTQKEATRLERGQQHVDNMETRAAADGKVTGKERRRIEHAEDVQSRKIYREKHDRQHDFNHDGQRDRPRRRH